MIDCEEVSALRLQVMWWACGHEFPMSTIGCETGSMDPLHVDQAMHVTKCLGRTITDAFESSRQQRIITRVQTLKAREPKRWKIETSSCSQTLKDGSNFQTSGSSNASGGCGEQQTSTSPALPLFLAPQNKSFPKNKIVLGKVF